MMSELFVAGAQRSGSTYLYHILDDHDEILMAKPVVPEPKYFINDDEYSKGRAYYEALYFGERTDQHRYIGEKSTSYIESPAAAERISAFYPDARILMMLRNPVLRAYSNYAFSAANGIESLSFEEALLAEPGRLEEKQYSSSVNPFAYKQRGHYMNYIEEYMKIFGRDQLMILITEEFVGNEGAVTELYSQLGVDSGHLPQFIGSKINRGNSGIRDVENWEDIVSSLQAEFAISRSRLEDCLGRKISVWDEV